MLPCFDVDVVEAHQTSSLITEGAIMQCLKTEKNESCQFRIRNDKYCFSTKRYFFETVCTITHAFAQAYTPQLPTQLFPFSRSQYVEMINMETVLTLSDLFLRPKVA